MLDSLPDPGYEHPGYIDVLVPPWTKAQGQRLRSPTSRLIYPIELCDNKRRIPIASTSGELRASARDDSFPSITRERPFCRGIEYASSRILNIIVAEVSLYPMRRWITRMCITVGVSLFFLSTSSQIYQDTTKTESSLLFEWECWDDCSCLPPVIKQSTTTTITIHQSYKTSDPQGWKEGWENYQQTWLKLHRESWRFIFWTDSQNALLATCSGYPNLLSGRSGIQMADLSRLLYLHTYGGLYIDMDYIALKDHRELFYLMSSKLSLKINNMVLLQGRQEQVVGLEWGYASTPHHPIWTFCLDIANRQKSRAKQACPIFYTGPKFLERCIRQYYHIPRTQLLQHMMPYSDDTNQSMMMILEPRLIAPIAAEDFTSECGRWRNVSNTPHQHNILWTEQWAQSTCHEHLMQNGTWAVTMYSHSWGKGLKC